MAISLPADIEANIRQKVEAGHFADAGDVVREAMRLLDDQERLLAPIRVKLRAGLDQLDRGEGDLFTPELVARMRRDANERFRKGDRPNPDVCP
ncbi:MAG TPA: type II toxin-antitoxin system ParD family antitoxin [Thermomicrobiales bacterium]|nr:type II toxin-antitoxin system ParD family antitoxin [Thermomicrobiales bacterium]